MTQATPAASAADIARAAEILSSGGLVAFPTETVYGLGADAENPAAVALIYQAKGRPSDHPVIVHVAPGADIGYWASEVPEEARKLIDAFWPGPLTLILKRNAHIPDAVSGGQDTVGIRCPSHPVAMALLRAFKDGKGGVAAPSANKFGNVSPTTAHHVRDEFGDSPLLGAVLDGGPSQVGIESTILDLSRLATHGPVLLRPGHIAAKQIADVIGIAPALPDADAPRASGTLESHYAPKAPVVLLPGDKVVATMAALAEKGRRVALIRYSDAAAGAMLAAAAAAGPASSARAAPHVALPPNPGGYAFGIYAALRAMDRADVDLIVVEAPPVGEPWQGINDRLRRAAHGAAGTLDRLLA